MKKTLRAGDVMTSPVKSVELGTTLDEVTSRLADEGITGLLVVDHQGKPVGVVSHADVVGYVAGLDRGRSGTFYIHGELRDDARRLPVNLDEADEDTLRAVEVDAVMTPEVIWVPTGMSLPDVARVMVERRIHRVLAESGGRVVGIVSTLDLLRGFASPPRSTRRKQPAPRKPSAPQPEQAKRPGKKKPATRRKRPARASS